MDAEEVGRTEENFKGRQEAEGLQEGSVPRQGNLGEHRKGIRHLFFKPRFEKGGAVPWGGLSKNRSKKFKREE